MALNPKPLKRSFASSSEFNGLSGCGGDFGTPGFETKGNDGIGFRGLGV